MKKLYTLLLIAFSISGFTASAQAGHDIRIKIKGFPKDSMARIGYYYGKSRYNAQDSARADKNGMLHFKGKKSLPVGVYICLMPKAYFEFLVTEQSFSLETDTADLELHMKVKGSKENAIFYEFRKFTTQAGRKADSMNKILVKRKNADSVKMLKDKMRSLDKNVDSFRKAFIAKYPKSFSVRLLEALPEPDIPETPTLPNGHKDSTFAYRYFKNHYFDRIDFSDERMIRTPFFEGKLEFYLKNLLQPYPDSIIVDVDAIIEKSKANSEVFKYTLSWMLNHYEESQIMGMDAVTSHLIERYYLTGQATWITDAQKYNMAKRDSIVSHLLIGKTAPELYLTDSTGKLINLSSVHKKYVILYFWDATCGHCQHATPLLHEFYEKNKNNIDLEIYAATIERKTKDWTKYIRDNKIGDWINVWDSYTVTDFNKMYDIYSTPVIYILDVNKKIIAKRLDVSQLQDYFDHLEKKDKKP
jgi:thiol-disulfide isomerase/thioredoxin